MNNIPPAARRLLISTLLLMSAGSSHAALTVGDVDDLQQQNVILSQQARAAELRQRIAQAQSQGAATVPAAPQENARPQLTGIQGARGHLEARVQHGRQVVRLTTGQNWPGTTVTLREIRPDSVMLSDGTRLSPGDSYAQ
ncbi:type IV pilus biogenesis protein PilP [Escherichia coli]|uniref:type IV pilus biogenesis protein PilP n=1 Tax=Escherichia coli TaxID=562 RepID=UPI0005C73C9F|nr:type IV pilus biogenesis protein PilP [Escherichia coli]